MRIKRDPLDILFSQYMRLKADGICEKCLRWVGYGKLQTSHLFGRRYKALRYDEENVSTLCFSCHQHFHEQPVEHILWFTERHGQQAIDLLQARARVTYPKPDKVLIELYLRERIKQIKEVLE